MELYIPHNIFHLARLLYVGPETFDPIRTCHEETNTYNFFEGLST